MRTFLKSFLGAFVALILFAVLIGFFLVGMVGGLASRNATVIPDQSVLVLDPGQHFTEQGQSTSFTALGGISREAPGLFDLVRIIRDAATDDKIRGILLVADNNNNDFASTAEIREALVAFRRSGKFLLAHGDMISQQSYSLATAAEKIYLTPQGMFDWSGYSVEYLFLKGALEKLEIQPQIFYAGKFKSATEPLRATEMTPENRLQTAVWLNDLYSSFLVQTSEARKVDTATLHRLANEVAVKTPEDALRYRLVDGLKYDDEVKDEIKTRLKIGKYQKINFVSVNTYKDAWRPSSSGSKIALIYAQGDIIEGKSAGGSIGGQTYVNLIHKARLDQDIKAIVFRINSGGGSTLASEKIWRELEIAKKEKPVIVSFGDVAASGGYYVSCGADSIFASPYTITGSIGVFAIIPNMQSFFNNKLGVTFDGVKTAEHADLGAIYRPLSDAEKQLIQGEIDQVYVQFKKRVSEGRKLDPALVDSIAQGRVWTGRRALELGLIDRFGGLTDAVASAAKLAKLTEYQLQEFPEKKNWIEELIGNKDPLNSSEMIRTQMGEENFRIWSEIKRLREISGSVQARMPFQLLFR